MVKSTDILTAYVQIPSLLFTCSVDLDNLSNSVSSFVVGVVLVRYKCRDLSELLDINYEEHRVSATEVFVLTS